MTHAANLLCATALAGLTASAAFADDLRIRSEFGFSSGQAPADSLTTILGFPTLQTANAGVRLMWEGATEDLRYELHSNLSYASGDAVRLADLGAPSAPPPTLFDLTTELQDTNDTQLTHTIDRAWLGYASDAVVIKAGRQAITWGRGMVFHPSDIVAPFRPDSIDTSYKPGVDMVYGQYLLDSGSDIEAIWVPRSTSYGGPIDPDQSTLAVRFNITGDTFDGSLMAAKDREDTVWGVGISGPLAGASFNAEYVHWTLANGDVMPSWLFNITRFGTLGEINVSYSAEYYHNGFGTDASVPLDALPKALTDKMATGQTFYPGTDYLALVASAQLGLDLTVAPSAIISTSDRSALIGLGANYALGGNTDLSFNLFRPVGAKGTEFGGRETSAGASVYGTAPTTATLRLVHFF